ncbi:M20/M25/M40 family metallo-hydrolase [Cellulomonas sp. 73-92]|uniref:M20/M25/M40 family metallo-hydrolase n=1 Tax=Cellulomonas sp. 73-92 TaxID=1895740 RepID=UPI000A734929|nr:M20/M25/M40 family metallo-hydrolase [Cellulomonas sp. 73-92]
MSGRSWGCRAVVVAAGAVVGAAAAHHRVRTFRPPAPAGPVAHAEAPEPFATRAAEHLAALVRIPTISEATDAPARTPREPRPLTSGTGPATSPSSREPRTVDRGPGFTEGAPSPFDAFRDALRELYPRVHAQLEVERVARHGLLLRWRGASDERPVVLMAHQDVVPVVPAEWTSGDPFSGEIRDGSVWGRGTLDDKGSLAVLLEAVESLLGEGFVPAQDVWLSLGDDEEIAGISADAAVARLRELGVRPWLVLDEGGAVVTGAFPGVEAPIAVVGVTEKGILDVEMSTAAAGGHASTPERGGATWRLARAITRLEAHPFPPAMTGPVLEMVDGLGRHSSPVLRSLFAFAGPLAPVLARVFTRVSPETNAMVRTTVVATMLEGAPGANVVATSARANLNVRIAPGETVASVLARLRRVIADDEVDLRVVASTEPSPVSPTDAPQFALVRSAVGAAYPDALVSPYVMLAASDARHFTSIAQHVYRFSPFAMTREQREGLHGNDEHVTVDALGRGVVFYRALLRGLADR